MAHVAEWKKKEVAQLAEMLDGMDVIGIVGIGSIAARQIQQMRGNLRGSATLRVVKNRLLRLALEDCGKDRIEGLNEFVNGQIAIITCKENPFKLYQILEGTKTPAPAKGGDLAPYDINVKKGETSFKPGPIIAELQRAGFPASIEKGKVVFKKNKTIVKEVSDIVAGLLTKLEIYPMEVGLLLKGVYDDGEIILPKALDIDVDSFAADIGTAAHNAMALALSIAYVNPVTILPLLARAHQDSMALAITQGIVSPDTLPPIISKVHSEMLSIASKLSSDAVGDGLAGLLAGRAAAAPAVAPAVKEEASSEPDEADDDEEEEVSEEEAVSGLGALFG